MYYQNINCAYFVSIHFKFNFDENLLILRLFMKLAFVLLLPVFLLTACSSELNKVLKSKDYEYKLKKADEYFVKKKYKYAEELYIELFSVFKGSDKFEDLYYKYAYC